MPNKVKCCLSRRDYQSNQGGEEMKRSEDQWPSLRTARMPEEPYAGKPHVGIREGGVRQLTFLP